MPSAPTTRSASNEAPDAQRTRMPLPCSWSVSARQPRCRWSVPHAPASSCCSAIRCKPNMGAPNASRYCLPRAWAAIRAPSRPSRWMISVNSLDAWARPSPRSRCCSTRVPFAASETAAPTSRSSGACSRISAMTPRRRSSSASVSPPIPAPMITIREAADDIRPPCAAGRYSQRTSGRSILADRATGASLRLFSGQRARAADAELTICLLCSRGGTGRARTPPRVRPVPRGARPARTHGPGAGASGPGP